MASWEALQAILCVAREELVANRSVFASRRDVNGEFGGTGNDCWGKTGERKAHWSGPVLALRAEDQITTKPAAFMSYSIMGRGVRREEAWQCAPFDRSCIGDIVMGLGRSVVGSAHDSPALAADSGRVQPAVPGNGPSSPRGGDCQAARSGGSARSHPEGHAARTAAGIRPRTRPSLSAAARVCSPYS